MSAASWKTSHNQESSHFLVQKNLLCIIQDQRLGGEEGRRGGDASVSKQQALRKDRTGNSPSPVLSLSTAQPPWMNGGHLASGKG